MQSELYSVEDKMSCVLSGQDKLPMHLELAKNIFSMRLIRRRDEFSTRLELYLVKK